MLLWSARKRQSSDTLEHAEKAGKEVHPLIIPTNRPLDAILRTARSLDVQELVLGTALNVHARRTLLGAFRRRTQEQQVHKIATAWAALHNASYRPHTVPCRAPRHVTAGRRRELGA